MVQNDKDILINRLIECLDIEKDFIFLLTQVLSIQLEDIIEKNDLNMILNYCENNLKSYTKKRISKYKEFYSNFNESELSDIIIFHKSEAGKKFKSLSQELAKINQKSLIDAVEDKNLNILIEKILNKKKK